MHTFTQMQSRQNCALFSQQILSLLSKEPILQGHVLLKNHNDVITCVRARSHAHTLASIIFLQAQSVFWAQHPIHGFVRILNPALFYVHWYVTNFIFTFLRHQHPSRTQILQGFVTCAQNADCAGRKKEISTVWLWLWWLYPSVSRVRTNTQIYTTGHHTLSCIFLFW